MYIYKLCVQVYIYIYIYIYAVYVLYILYLHALTHTQKHTHVQILNHCDKAILLYIYLIVYGVPEEQTAITI